MTCCADKYKIRTDAPMITTTTASSTKMMIVPYKNQMVAFTIYSTFFVMQMPFVFCHDKLPYARRPTIFSLQWST